MKAFRQSIRNMINYEESAKILTKRADLTGLQPSRDAVEVEGMVAHTPGHGALL